MTDSNHFASWLLEQFALIPTCRAVAVARRAGIVPGYLSALRKATKNKPSQKTVEAIAGAIAEIRKLDSAGTTQLVEKGLRAAGLPATTPKTSKASTPVCQFEVVISIAIYQK